MSAVRGDGGPEVAGEPPRESVGRFTRGACQGRCRGMYAAGGGPLRCASGAVPACTHVADDVFGVAAVALALAGGTHVGVGAGEAVPLSDVCSRTICSRTNHVAFSCNE